MHKIHTSGNIQHPTCAAVAPHVHVRAIGSLACAAIAPYERSIQSLDHVRQPEYALCCIVLHFVVPFLTWHHAAFFRVGSAGSAKSFAKHHNHARNLHS
jgi:hypothetical protein